ncbi:TssN family type VI secretion system protein [Aquiflexum sp. AIY15W]|nr:TssN family type VI secretion system protein [Cognataquiflexum rubidum]
MKATLIYLLIGFLLCSIIAGLAYWSHLKDQQVFLVTFQFYFLLLGIAHVNWMDTFLKWAGKEKSLPLELIFSILIALAGSIGFVLVLRVFGDNGLEIHMAGSIIWFIVPWFVNRSFYNALEIPDKIFKLWYYHVGKDIEEPDESKLKNLVLVSFLIQKKMGDKMQTHFRAKAPLDMEFGELFYYFINDYNERNSQEKIEFLDKSGEPYGWIFYKKPEIYTIKKDYLDAEKTVFNNFVKENNIIICKRILES